MERIAPDKGDKGTLPAGTKICKVSEKLRREHTQSTKAKDTHVSVNVSFSAGGYIEEGLFNPQDETPMQGKTNSRGANRVNFCTIPLLIVREGFLL